MDRFNFLLLLVFMMACGIVSCGSRKVTYRCRAAYGDNSIMWLIPLDSAYKAGDTIVMSLFNDDNPSRHTRYVIDARVN